jgi:hypothetical protein
VGGGLRGRVTEGGSAEGRVTDGWRGVVGRVSWISATYVVWHG